MATSKALWTTQSDFAIPQTKGPTQAQSLYYDGVTPPTGGSYFTTAVFAPGVKGQGFKPGKANYMKTSRTFTRTTVKPTIISMWIKPTASDISPVAGKNYSIFFTTRGHGQSPNIGFHAAIYYDSTVTGSIPGDLEVRFYNNAGSSVTINSRNVSKALVADQWYNIVIVYWDTPTSGHRMEVWVNNQLWMYSDAALTISTFTRIVTVGDMPGSGGVLAFPFDGVIDGVMIYDQYNGSKTEIIADYYNYIVNGNYIDDFTIPGSMIMAKKLDGTYSTTIVQSWISQIINMSTPFDDFGRVQLVYNAPVGTYIKVYTATSNDGITFDDFVLADTDGTIKSVNRPYIKVRIDFWTSTNSVTPEIQEIQILAYDKQVKYTLTYEPLIIYKDLSSGKQRLCQLNNAYDIYIIEELNGQKTIEFKLPIDDKQRNVLGTEAVEFIAKIGHEEFTVKENDDIKDDAGKKYSTFTGEATHYELIQHKVINFEMIEVEAVDMLNGILSASIVPTGWTIGRVQITGKKRTNRGKWKTVQELILDIPKLYGGELHYDEENRVIELLTRIGDDKGVRAYYNKNMKSIKRTIDTYDMVTRLYLYGKNDMTIASVHPQGLEYIENTAWADALNLRNKIRIGYLKDERYTIPQNLYDDGNTMLLQSCTPRIAYIMTLLDLSMLSGHELEINQLGDTITMIEPDFSNAVIPSRIVKRKYNVREPWKTEIELDQPRKMLADAQTRTIDDKLQVLTASNPLDTSDVQQMTVFNNLLNSRADDGFSNWVVTGTGTTIDPTGFSGSASFKMIGGYGALNSIKQSIYGISHRSAYTVSAVVATAGTITRGVSSDAFVGIKVTVHYKTPDINGKYTEDHYLAIPDITQQ